MINVTYRDYTSKVHYLIFFSLFPLYVINVTYFPHGMSSLVGPRKISLLRPSPHIVTYMANICDFVLRPTCPLSHIGGWSSEILSMVVRVFINIPLHMFIVICRDYTSKVHWILFVFPLFTSNEPCHILAVGHVAFGWPKPILLLASHSTIVTYRGLEVLGWFEVPHAKCHKWEVFWTFVNLRVF